MYDELLLLFAKASQRYLWHEAQHNAVVRRASADRNRWSVRWLLHMSHGLIVCGLTLRALCQPNPEHYDPQYMELWKLANTSERGPGID